MKDFARHLGLGRFAYRFYYRPRRTLRTWRKQGIQRTLALRRGRAQMERAAGDLPPLSLGGHTPESLPEIHFLTGRDFWFQTVFCAYSLMKQAGQFIRPVIYGDDSLVSEQIDQIRRIIPWARWDHPDELQERLDAALPEHRYPSLRERNRTFPNFRKIVQVHAGSAGWKLVLDSDILFFRSPEFLLEWLDNPQRICVMLDKNRAYGYSEALMAELTGAPIPDRLNVGICGMNSDTLDWDRLEYWTKTMIECEGMHYYLEQALCAMVAATQGFVVPPEEEYICLPRLSAEENPRAILHHYVASSKSLYFCRDWKITARNAGLEIG